MIWDEHTALADTLGETASVTVLADVVRVLNEMKLLTYQPYECQLNFHALGAENDEGLFIAANQIGKSLCGSAEMAIHLTGRYPEWWNGRVFSKAGIRAMAGSESAELTTKGVQRLLLGTPEDEAAWGTGLLPKSDIVGFDRKQGVPNALDNIQVQHYNMDGVKDGISVLKFGSFDQGRTKWQADTLDLVWLDEEPPDDVYMEAITRTNATGGYVYITATPLKGMSAP